MKFPFIRQHDSMQCGVACLTMICRYYGARITLRDMEEICPPSPSGVSMKGLCDAAVSIGMKAYPIRLDIDSLGGEMLPCVVHWNQNHLKDIDSGKPFCNCNTNKKMKYLFQSCVFILLLPLLVACTSRNLLIRNNK